MLSLTWDTSTARNIGDNAKRRIDFDTDILGISYTYRETWDMSMTLLSQNMQSTGNIH